MFVRAGTADSVSKLSAENHLVELTLIAPVSDPRLLIPAETTLEMPATGKTTPLVIAGNVLPRRKRLVF
jgi:hypothetical protein